MNIPIPCFPCTLTILFYRNVILFNFIVWGRNLDLSGLSNIMWLCEWHLDSTIVFLHSFYFHSILYFLELQLYLCVVRITIKILFYILEPTNFTSEGNQENPKNQFHTPISRSHLEFAVVARCRELCPGVNSAGARSKNSATNHSTFQKTSELFSIGGGHVVPVVNNTTCFSIYKWLLFLLLFSSYFPLLSHSFLK